MATSDGTFRHFGIEPPRHDVDVYLSNVQIAWDRLLADSPTEARIHAFIEEHPCLLPDPYKSFKRGHHGMITGLIYSKPVLPGSRQYIPDFMFVAMDSAGIFPTLIEIEAPGKTHATAEGLPSAALRHARGQLSDWSQWFDDPENQIAFRRMYGITDDIVRVRRLRPRYVLVYGRRADALQNPRFARTRADAIKHDTIEMTYDRMEPNLASATAPVVRIDTSRPGDILFRVVSVSPLADAHTFQFIDTSRVVGLEEAIRSQPLISPERREWLLEEAGSLNRSFEETRREAMEAGEATDRDAEDYDDDEEPD